MSSESTVVHRAAVCIKRISTCSARGYLLTRKWEEKTSYSTVEALLTYPIRNGVSAIAGYRAIAWSSAYKGPVAGLLVSPTAGAYSIEGLTVGAGAYWTAMGGIDQEKGSYSANYLVLNGDIAGGDFVEVLSDYTFPADLSP